LVLAGGCATTAVWSAPPAFQQAVLDDQPVLYYKFDQTTGDAVNHGSLGATHNAVYNGTVVRGAPTPFGDALPFDTDLDVDANGVVSAT
jgi:hypothetical protein